MTVFLHRRIDRQDFPVLCHLSGRSSTLPTTHRCSRLTLWLIGEAHQPF
jgi:hypothetical protein